MLTESITGDGIAEALLKSYITYGHERVLTCVCSSEGFLTESGKKKASVILSTEDQSNFQATQMKIKVRRPRIQPSGAAVQKKCP